MADVIILKDGPDKGKTGTIMTFNSKTRTYTVKIKEANGTVRYKGFEGQYLNLDKEESVDTQTPNEFTPILKPIDTHPITSASDEKRLVAQVLVEALQLYLEKDLNS